MPEIYYTKTIWDEWKKNLSAANKDNSVCKDGSICILAQLQNLSPDLLLTVYILIEIHYNSSPFITPIVLHLLFLSFVSDYCTG